MPDDPNPGQESKDSAAQDAEDKSDSKGQESEESFDKDRALATIRKLRETERAAKAQAKEYEALKAKVQEHETAQLSEKEKADKRADEAEKKAQAAETRVKTVSLRASVERHAHKLNVIDDDAAYRLLDLTAVEYDDNGEPQNVEALMKVLVKDRPYLVAPEGKNGVPATPKPTDSKALSEAEQAAHRQAFGTQVSRMFR